MSKAMTFVASCLVQAAPVGPTDNVRVKYCDARRKSAATEKREYAQEKSLAQVLSNGHSGIFAARQHSLYERVA